jgi:tetratricopeptide (TPR) repeat protein
MFLLCLSAFPGQAAAAAQNDVSQDHPAEYMIYQYPGVALLIKVDAAETEFSSRIYGPDRALIMASGVPGRRLGPVFQFIEAVSTPRQLIIEVTPGQATERSRIAMEVMQVPLETQRNSQQAQAFSLLSLATQLTEANDSTTWAMKVYTLKRAAAAFEQLGSEELRLWSEYYAAHLVLQKLSDEISATEFAQELQLAARKAGIRIIELAALQLEGDALMAVAAAGPGQTLRGRYEGLHRVFERAAKMADGMGFQSERARALLNDGMTWERQENLTKALEQYRLALSIAVSAGNVELANQVRNKAAFAYETQGSISGAIEMLDQISDEQQEKKEQQKLAQSQFEKGRILADSYHYTGATVALLKAMHLQKTAGLAGRQGPTGLVLGQVYYNMGFLDLAVATLREAITKTPASAHTEQLEQAFDTLAAIHRFRGEFELMSDNREQQSSFLSSGHDRARYVFEQALDALAENSTKRSRARSLFIQSRQMAVAEGDGGLQHRALLSLCALAPGEAGGEQLCTHDRARQSFEKLQGTAFPNLALEARFLWSRILRREGQLSRAKQQMSGLVEEVRFYQAVLPGVLGSWYWENKEAVATEYMSQVLQQTRRDEKGEADGRPALIALDQLRSIEEAGNPVLNPAVIPREQGDTEKIRSLLASHEQDIGSGVALPLDPDLDELMKLARTRFDSTVQPLELSELDRMLRNVGADRALLTYYFSGNDVYALVGNKTGVRLIRIRGASGIVSELEKIRSLLGKQDGFTPDARLASLGSRLLAPFARQLPEFIYLLPAGPLNGFPFDLLRIGDSYVAEEHHLVNVASLATLNQPVVNVNTGALNLFFLAGNPMVMRDAFDLEQNVSMEISAVTDIFVGPALHIVQGSALGRDEFQDERIEMADIIHLAIPGTIKLKFPGQSSLMLSGTAGKPSSEFLQPADFRGRNLKASLVFLSGTEVEGSPESRLDNRLGFVSDFLESGVQAVVTSLWRLNDREVASFVTEFYRNLESSPDVVLALSNTRRSMLQASSPMDYSLWGGFQIYIQ